MGNNSTFRLYFRAQVLFDPKRYEKTPLESSLEEFRLQINDLIRRGTITSSEPPTRDHATRYLLSPKQMRCRAHNSSEKPRFKPVSSWAAMAQCSAASCRTKAHNPAWIEIWFYIHRSTICTYTSMAGIQQRLAWSQKTNPHWSTCLHRLTLKRNLQRSTAVFLQAVTMLCLLWSKTSHEPWNEKASSVKRPWLH
ncbi:hypothetical protein BJX62DRAFT_135629 [Aspergillus germanicus]